MFTILQRQEDLGYKVLAKVVELDVARELASALCNQAGVKRTIVLDEWGMTVSVES